MGKALRKDPLDPDAPARLVRLGSPRRLRTIFDTNLRTSYAAGRWERIQRAKEDLPYLRYVATLDNRTRPDHREWHGTVLPVDHPFWQTHYPPNGWRCRCTVIQLSARQLRSRGYEVSEGPPPGSGRTREWVNTRTGEVQDVPVGIDPGWNHNTGVMGSAQKLGRLIDRLDEPGLDPGLARSMVREGIEGAAFRDFLTGAVPGDWPVAVAPRNVLDG